MHLSRHKEDMKKAPINLITPYFETRNLERQGELDRCLENNANNELIARVILLIDDDSTPPVKSSKITIERVETRPSYRDWFEVTEKFNLKGAAILANSDIFFDETVEFVHEVLASPLSLMALSRWEVINGSCERHANPHWSQDCWAYRPELGLPQEIKNRLGFPLGIPRCDNKISYVFATQGWSVKNPCNFIKSFHLHKTQQRNYDKKGDTSIVGGMAYVYPSETVTAASALHYDIWSVSSQDVVKVSVNNSLEKWRHERLTESRPARESNEEVVLQPGKVLGNTKLDLFKHGNRVCSTIAGMAIYENGDSILVATGRDSRDWLLLSKQSTQKDFTRSQIAELFKPCITDHRLFIVDRPQSEDDVNFWQYPCITEKQAFLDHHSISSPQIDGEKRKIEIYAPLPWATYIDTKCFPTRVIQHLGHEIAFLRALAQQFGYSLNVHTVCQHIRWSEILEHAASAGITDLAVSHCTTDTQTSLTVSGVVVRLHPWSLYAVNYCDNSRNQGLVVGRPMCERKYLTSFIGAHMPHYLTDVRMRLYESLSKLKVDDLLIDLGDLWHFNTTVYDHQVATKHTGSETPVDLTDSTTRYNQVLSDSKFSLCPHGAGINTLRLWESIAVGAVPVLFNHNLRFPVEIDQALSDLCLFWTEPEYGRKFYDWLKSFSDEELEKRSIGLRNVYAEAEKITCF